MTNDITDVKLDKVMVKINNLMNIANGDGGSQEERDAMLAGALGIMAQYNITESQLRESNKSEDDFIAERAAIKFDVSGPRTRRLIDLAAAIAEPMGVSVLYKSRRRFFGGGGYGHVSLYGRRSSIFAVKVLFATLQADVLSQAAKLKARRVEVDEEPSRPEICPTWYGKGEMRAATQEMRMSFIEGYTFEVGSRLREINKSLDLEHDGSLLPMLASDLSRAQELWPSNVSLGTDYGSGGSSSAYAAGLSAGSRANLGGNTMRSAPLAIGGGAS